MYQGPHDVHKTLMHTFCFITYTPCHLVKIVLKTIANHFFLDELYKIYIQEQWSFYRSIN